MSKRSVNLSDELTPVVRRLSGIGAGDADEEDYRGHLLDRYGA